MSQHQRPRRTPSSGLLHHLAAVLSIAGRPGAVAPTGVTLRRRRQKLVLAQRLLDPLPDALLPSSRHGERFWSALRWGGLGLLLAWLLRP
ncbi:hypothetical protein KBZ12_01300 [Cyanobium sp. Cruz CV13-4-11]|jgi:hypothetical protein|uniref:hypothetical protein n=1 Tax=unclassified Cyanobium TaxID=2627006 RepID=UPI0020CEF5B0|nr:MULTISPECIES: hypothetical protein [unclassified Cyanobium]MCP9899136.1 hypothetical protein [Cyanobium sp. Cruz CV11-17]MCP9918118.1 hypothetical protein [Cyanobium sp. Cruz CV13-4-11]